MPNSSFYPHFKKALETKAFLLFCILFFLIFQSLSYFTLWTETEIYPVHSSRHLWTDNMLHFLFSLKPLYYFTLYISSLLSSLLSTMPMTGARFLFALNGLLILSLMYFYIQKKTNRYNAILAVLFLASTNIFLGRGFRVRSDLIAVSFNLLAMLMALNIKTKADQWRFYVILPLLSFSFLVTAKSLYWVLLSSCFIMHDLKKKPSLPFILEIAGVVLSAFCLISVAFQDPFFLKSIENSWRAYFADWQMSWQFTERQGLSQYFKHYTHLSIFAGKNLPLIFLITVKFLFVIYSTLTLKKRTPWKSPNYASIFAGKTRPPALSPITKFLSALHSIVITKKRTWDLSDLCFFLLILILFFHPHSKLFFLCALMPFFCISFFTDSQWKSLIENSYSLKFKTLLLAGALLYSLSLSSWFLYKVWTKKNNSQQRKMVKELNEFYKSEHPSTEIFDPACLIWTRKTDCKYIYSEVPFAKQLVSYFNNNNFDSVLAIRHVGLWHLWQYKQDTFQYINIKNYVYYKALIWDIKKWESEQGKRSKKDKSRRPTQKILSGQKLFQILNSSLKTKVPEESRIYSHFFLDDKNGIIKNPPANMENQKNCHVLKNKILILQTGCFYSEEEFQKGQIPIGSAPAQAEKLALFYLPLPLGLSDNLSLRALLRYDMW